MKKVIRSVDEVILIDNINTQTVGLVINGTKYISVTDRGNVDRVGKMCYDLQIEDITYSSTTKLLDAFPNADSYAFETTKEAINWLIS